MAKDDEKYRWDWASQTFPTIDPHSKIKHQIIDEYIQTYIDVLMRNQQMPELGLSIVDGFSGGGIYDDGFGGRHYGSPLIALEAIQTSEIRNNIDRIKPRTIRSQHFFVDVKPENIACLHAVMASRNHAHRVGNDVHLHSAEFTQALPSIVQKLKSFGKGERALFLLDQYGYGEVPFPKINWIFKNLSKAEVLLTFNVDFLVTYLADRHANRKAISNIGLDNHVPWNSLKELKAHHPRNWQYIIQRYLSEGIKQESGARYMTIFFIRPIGNNPMTYWFIHLANNYRANDVMKKIHWKYGNNFSHMLSPSSFFGYDANRDIDVTGQPDLLLEEHHFDESTDNRIHSELSDLLPKQVYELESQPFINLMSGLTNYTMADEIRVKQALDTAIATGDLQAVDKDGKTRRRKGTSIKSTDILIAPQQRPIFFLPPLREKK
ncbi:three-Cys-motif partner protein [Pseudomonas sp. SLBN-26]|uniref:three-Cys-motif partner protein TcmP n=1 Tax=Pseudomonadaceae TaxID=135621 RepID=UPI0011510242|nr:MULTISPECIES: three-Cys-motif partner protein TcmP [Pseudomonas]MCP1617261.1 three-Cys-motif partner protein [Pseudomonas otitidis]TQL06503.1 three-Cys-motif partner protein [Pseudomonas sp. SLBN-26]